MNAVRFTAAAAEAASTKVNPTTSSCDPRPHAPDHAPPGSGPQGNLSREVGTSTRLPLIRESLRSHPRPSAEALAPVVLVCVSYGCRLVFEPNRASGDVALDGWLARWHTAHLGSDGASRPLVGTALGTNAQDREA